MDHTV